MEYESSCSGFKKYRKAVAFLDIIIGFAGIIKLCCFTYINRIKWNGYTSGTEKLPFIATDLNDELLVLDNELKTELILYLIPSIFTILVGVLVLVAARKDSFVWSKVAVTMNIMLIAISGGIVGIVFGLGTYWMRLIPLMAHTCLQVFFLAIVLELCRSTRHLVKLM